MVAVPNNSNKSTTIVQITDSHLFQETDGCLLGISTYSSLRAVIDKVLSEQPDVHLVLGTGDISQDGTASSYRHFIEQVSRIDAPLRWMAGNHDVNSVLHSSSAATQWLQPIYDLDAWRIILLDSSVDGSVFGYLTPEQLQLLEQALDTAEERHVLIALHHHPVPIGCAWLNNLGLRNADEFLAITDRYSSVKGVIWGHIHQEFESLRNDVHLLSAPSTCVQFKPQSIDFAVDDCAPGYRWLKLFNDGRFSTGVSRVAADLFHPDMDVTGY